MNHCLRFFICSTLLFCLRPQSISAEEIKPAPGATGIFQTNSDVGSPLHAGSVAYDAARNSYLVTGGGANMWATNDAFHFVWKKVSGDVSLAADITLVGTEGDAHRKACLLIRQSLAPDSVYADAAIHGNGLISLQYRDKPGGITATKEGQPSAPATVRVRIEKRGDQFSIAIKNGDKTQVSGPIALQLDSPFYVGLAVCAHDNKALRQAVFSHVELKEKKSDAGQ